jgi:hypothetical protein
VKVNRRTEEEDWILLRDQTQPGHLIEMMGKSIQ